LILEHPAAGQPLARLECLHRLQQIRAEAGELSPPVFAPSPFRHACIPALLRYLSQQMDYFAWHGLNPASLAARSRAFEAALFALAGHLPQKKNGSGPASSLSLPQARALLRAGWARHFGLDAELQAITPGRLETALTQGLPVCVLGSDGLEIPGDTTLHASLLLPGQKEGPDPAYNAIPLRHFDPLLGRETLLGADELALSLTRLGAAALILMPRLPCPRCA
jgi:hypothetical protein